jgi:hypothetical protein
MSILALHVLAFSALPAASDPAFFGTIDQFVLGVQNWLLALGATVFVIGVVVGGLMRITAFGSERRIAASNAALSCAVIGFIIILLSFPLVGLLQGLFPE